MKSAFSFIKQQVDLRSADYMPAVGVPSMSWPEVNAIVLLIWA